MKSIPLFRLVPALLTLLAALGGTPVARAIAYTIDLDTTSIVDHAAGPFSLDFQSIFGSGSDQKITISNFQLSGGGFVAGTDVAIGAVAGDTGGALVFRPGSASFLNEFWQQFAATVTNIRFDLDVTNGPADGTPTSFAVSILDASLFPIPTSGFADTLLFLELGVGKPSPQTAVSGGDASGVTVGVHVAEQGTTGVLLAMSLVVMQILTMRGRRVRG